MGRLIAVLVLAGAAAFAVKPGSNSSARAHSAVAAPAAHVTASAPSTEGVFESAEKDLASRQSELGLVGAAPLFGAEGLPKPATVK